MKCQVQAMVLTALLCSVGPSLTAQWVQTNGPDGGPVTSFALIGIHLFAGTTGGGVYCSSNMGTAWTAVHAGMTNTVVWSLAVSPNGAGDTNIYAGTYGGGVFLSTNGGTGWSAASDGLTDYYVLALAIDGIKLFAGTLGGVFLSTNAGTTWTAVNNGLTNLYVRTLAVNGGNLFAGTYGGGVFLSTDSGTTWTAASTGLTNMSILNFAFLGPHLFAGTYGGIFHSTDGAKHWTPVVLEYMSPASSFLGDTRIPGSANANSGLLPGDSLLSTKAIYSLAVNGADLYVGTYGGGVLRSTDAGTSWTPVNAGLGSPNLSVLSIAGMNLYAGTLGGEVWRRPLSEVTFVPGAVGGMPGVSGLEQNYPNPFNPTTEIVFRLTRKGHVKLVVFDLLGRELTTLVEGDLQPGSYRSTFNSSRYGSGTYLYRLMSGEGVQARKMVCVK